MSRFEWESGTITLAATAFPEFRQAMQAADLKHRQKVFAVTQDCWRSLTRHQQTDAEAYRHGLAAYLDRRFTPGAYTPAPCGSYSISATEFDNDVLLAAVHLMQGRAKPIYQQHPTVPLGRIRTGYTKPTRVLASEMQYPTNRTTIFGGSDCVVVFDKKSRTVTWEVGENNHAVEEARESHIGKAFFAHLATIRWARGTGGVIAGNDEYNQDDSDLVGGANYPVDGYGYLGAKYAPSVTSPFLNTKGERVTPPPYRINGTRVV